MILQTFLLQLSLLVSGLITFADAAFLETHGDDFVPDAVLVVTEEEVKQSCVPTKNIIVVNGTSPGPELTFNVNETVWIRVYNNIPDQNLTMHWHGLTIATAPFSDGTPQAAQWPLPPNTYFDYELHVPDDMAGTYFYHSHVGFQAISCTGPLRIIEQGPPPFEYDEERYIFIQDNFPDNDSVIEHALLARPMAYEKAQTIVLINGQGGGFTGQQQFCNESLSSINVQPGKRYRFRVIGATSLAFVSFAIEDHPNLRIIEADAGYTKEYNTSFIQVGPGGRFSFLLDTMREPEKQQYYIQVETRDFGPPTNSFAVLNYGRGVEYNPGPFYPPAPNEVPIELPPTDTNWLEYQLEPLFTGTDFCTEITRRVNITFNLEITDDGGLIYLMNNQTWQEAFVQEPYLVSLYKNDGIEFPSMARALQNDGLDLQTFAFPAQIGECLEIVVQGRGSSNGGVETHPWHAHGAHYYDMGSGDGVYDRDANNEKWANSPGQPVKRDTTNIYSYGGKTNPGQLFGWRTWRLKVTQVGVWMIHCHLLPHMVWGMQTAWVMGNSTEVLNQIPRPMVKGYLNYNGSVVGTEFSPPQVVNFFDYPDWSMIKDQ